MKDFPGPGKYQTIDTLGSGKNFYNSKHRNQHQKSFNGRERFNQCKWVLTQRSRLRVPATTPSRTPSSPTASTCSPT